MFSVHRRQRKRKYPVNPWRKHCVSDLTDMTFELRFKISDVCSASKCLSCHQVKESSAHWGFTRLIVCFNSELSLLWQQECRCGWGAQVRKSSARQELHPVSCLSSQWAWMLLDNLRFHRKSKGVFVFPSLKASELQKACFTRRNAGLKRRKGTAHL